LFWLLLLLAGSAQRAVNLARPTWTWLVPVSRTAINVFAVALQFAMFRGFPYVVVSPAAAGPARYAEAAEAFNNLIQWGFLSWLWIYFLVSALIYARFCVPHVRRWLLLRHERAVLAL